MHPLLVRILTGFMPTKAMRRAFRSKYINNSDSINIVSYCQSNRIIVVQKDGTEIQKQSIEGCRIEFYGKNSTVKIHEPYHFENCTFKVGDNNFIEIGRTRYSILNFIMPYPMKEKSKLFIGKDFSCMDCQLFLHDEPNITIKIGEDCQFSFGIIIWPSDGHTILDGDRRILNKGEDIYIGNHVWLGMNSTVLKGARIPDNSVVGAKSVFTRGSNPYSTCVKGGIYIGTPAKLFKSGIAWDRRNPYDYDREVNNENS